MDPLFSPATVHIQKKAPSLCVFLMPEREIERTLESHMDVFNVYTRNMSIRLEFQLKRDSESTTKINYAYLFRL